MHSLQTILDTREAARIHLNHVAYNNELTELFSGEGDYLTVVAFEKANRNPCGIAIFEKSPYNPSDIQPLPSVELGDDISTISRKSIWKLSFCIRRADQKGKCLGDICMATGLEAVFNHQLRERRPTTTYVWLILAGNDFTAVVLT